MNFYDFAKCSLLENMVATNIGLPLWQTGTVVLSILFAQFAGTFIGYRIGERQLPVGTLRAGALASSSMLLAAALVITVVSGLQYVLFLLRMVKDGFYCTYFGASNALTWYQAVALLIALIGNLTISAWFAARPGSATPRNRWFCQLSSAASCVAPMSSTGLLSVAGVTVFHAFLIGLAWRARQSERLM
jgi:hypothetical protein